MLTELFNYKVKGLSKEEIIAEFNNLLSWEKQEVIDELHYVKAHLSAIITIFN